MRISSRLIQESSRISENQGLDLFENQFQTYSRIGENHQESMRIHFTLIRELAIIIENRQESSRINKNHIKDKVLPL